MFTIIRVIIDIICVGVGYVLAYLIRFNNLSFAAIISFPIGQYVVYFWLLIVIYLLCYYIIGMYKQRKGFLVEIDEMIGSLGAVTVVWIILIVLTYIKGEYEYSRPIILLSWPIVMILSIVLRSIVLQFELFARSKGLGSKRAAIIGSGELAQKVAKKIKDHPSYGLQFVRFIDFENMARLEAAIKGDKIQAIFVADPSIDRNKLTDLAAFCDGLGLELGTIPDIFQILTSSPSVENIEGIPTISLKRPKFSFFNRFLKRTFDITLSLFGIIIFAIPMVIIWLLIRLTSPGGPAIYSQERVGRGGRTFDLLKFRTMIPDAEARTGPVLSSGEDPRKTPLGKILRATNLDELPQLFNILKGDMSFVGPRPERPVFVEEFKQLIPKYMERHKIRPGLAGWAQLHGGYHMPAEEKIKYDLYYIENWSFLLDIKIILKYIQIAFTFQRRN